MTKQEKEYLEYLNKLLRDVRGKKTVLLLDIIRKEFLKIFEVK